MKKYFLCILFASLCTFSFSQDYEGYVFELSSRTKFYLPINDVAKLDGDERYIHLGLLGSVKDVNDLVGYIDRFIINDHDMVASVGTGVTEEMVSYYKFYLNPLYDANNFQQMLMMFKVNNFFIGNKEYPIKDFSNMVYASIKSKNK